MKDIGLIDHRATCTRTLAYTYNSCSYVLGYCRFIFSLRPWGAFENWKRTTMGRELPVIHSFLCFPVHSWFHLQSSACFTEGATPSAWRGVEVGTYRSYWLDAESFVLATHRLVLPWQMEVPLHTDRLSPRAHCCNLALAVQKTDGPTLQWRVT